MAAASSAKKAQKIRSVEVSLFKNKELHPCFTCRFKYRNIWYSSVCHAMAALQFENKARWAYGGEFDNWEEIRDDINEENLARGEDKETFHNMGEVIGILAEHVRARPRRYKLKPIAEYGWTRFQQTLAAVYAAKFMTNGKLNELGVNLLDTTGRIKIPGRQYKIFGKILTQWRDERKEDMPPLGKRKRDASQDEIQFVKKRTIEDKFADAAANGSVVDLASDDDAGAPPALTTPAYKSIPGYSNLFGSDDEAEPEPKVEAAPPAASGQSPRRYSMANFIEQEDSSGSPPKVNRKNFLQHYPAWKIKEVVRKSGASAGHIDYQYIAPSGKVCRSIKEVQRWIEFCCDQ